MTRVAIGHGSYVEFAFPCHECKVEIRFAMTIDQENSTFSYERIVNGSWMGHVEVEPNFVHMLDGENLIPLKGGHFSPFQATAFLAEDVRLFHRDREVRYATIMERWTIIENLRTHLQTKNWKLFDATLKQLRFKQPVLTTQDRLLAEHVVLEEYGRIFRPFTEASVKLIKQQIINAEAQRRDLTDAIVSEAALAGKHDSLWSEVRNIRSRWSKLFFAFCGIYSCFYWDDSKHTLDDYSLSEKRFEDIKLLYVECFETLCRLSVIAATLEGVLTLGVAAVPTAKGHILPEAFAVQDNGSKPDVLKNLQIGILFAPFMDGKLRNGIGHHSSSYDVNSDAVNYSNHNKSGATSYSITYVRFCEKVVRLYAQIELAAIYLYWLRARANGIAKPIF